MEASSTIPLSPTGRSPLWRLDGPAVVGCVAFGILAWLSRQPAKVELGHYFLVMAVAWAALLCAWKLARDLPETAIVTRLWGWAIALRVVGFLGAPVLEDDFWRYLWDGRMFALTGNPYATAPLAHFADAMLPGRFQEILDQINHPDVPTIYGPGCQFAFALSYWIAPGQLWPWKLLLLGADLLTLWWLRSMVSARHALLYAWCPLLIQETAFTAHPDSMAIVAVVGALVAFRRRNWHWMAGALALAGATRLPALLMAPLLLWSAPRKSWATFAGVAVVLHLPFWLQGSMPGFGGTAAFVGHWEFNSTVYALLQAMANPAMAKMLAAGLFLTFYAGYFVRWEQQRRAGEAESPRGDVVFGMFFLLSAVVNAWYLLWLVPFVAWRPSATGLAALIAVSLSYATGLNLGDSSLGAYDHPGWVRPLEVGIVALAALWDLLRGQRERGITSRQNPP